MFSKFADYKRTCENFISASLFATVREHVKVFDAIFIISKQQIRLQKFDLSFLNHRRKFYRN